MTSTAKKSAPSKSVPMKTVAGKSVIGKSVPMKSLPGKRVPGKAVASTPSNGSLKNSTTNGKSFVNTRGLLPSSDENISTYITLPPCAHLNKVLQTNARDAVLKSYAAALNIVIFGNLPSTQHDVSISQFANKSGERMSLKSIKRIRSKILKCKDCHDSVEGHNNLYMCLQCTNIGCWSKGHAFSHLKNTNHVFGINPDNGELMCLKCGDLVFHPLLERIRFNAFKSAGILNLYPGLSCFQTEHDNTNHELLLKSTRLPSFKEHLGLKGFINLGSTCFMSSVLQTIIHNPFIKRYYLSDLHSDCNKPSNECLSCCLNQIYQDFFTNPGVSGFGLTSFIEAAWKVKRTLAGYSEQDAHEFWQFLIHQIHKNDTKCSKYIKNKESTPALESAHKQNLNCDCIIHKTFSGSLESTLTCTVCGNQRKIEDPMLDISLEIQDKKNNEKSSLENLDECFKKYTKSEELDVLYECSHCNKRTKVHKSLKLSKLPPVLSIQLKRFEHFGVSSKIDYHIDMPTILDLKDYISNTIINQTTTYELFGIVCHIGSVNTGHYIAYVKSSNGIWFKFDDATITRLSESEVKKVNGYMLVYCVSGNAGN